MQRSSFPLPVLLLTIAAGTSIARHSNAQTGAPPPEAKAMVEAPKETAAPPKTEKPTEGTTITLSAGGMAATGNSRLVAGSANGAADTRQGDNGFGASVLGNYGRSAAAGESMKTTTQNIQGRLRYDRYLTDRVSVFLILTGRHDRFQGLDFRLNVDPGVKYLFIKEQANALWGEAGYDFQYDIRRDDARVVLDANGDPVLDTNGEPVLVDKTAVDHSTRLFAGYHHAFNEEVTFSTGLEYLQSVIESTRYRLNYDAIFAAKVGGGLALGIGFSARYDHAPLPGKERLDTATTVGLIYAFSDTTEKKD